MTDPRLSVHTVAFPDTPWPDLVAHWQDFGVRRLSLIDHQLAEPDLPALVADGYVVQAVCHVFGGGRLPADDAQRRASRDRLRRVADAAAAVGAGCVYLLTGGRGEMSWEQAASRFAEVLAPGVEHAAAAGVPLAIENASGLYADIHIAHTLRDTVTLAESAGVGVCIDLFHCWAEADLAGLLRRALPRLALIQLSDYVLGDRALPARAVPGDGAIPIAPFVADALAAGYRGGFDLELIGPRIDAEGAAAAARRACDVTTALLEAVGDGVR
ncbi:sugar phosphate isomerase/epimerase [Mycobacterium sp. MYCO198283]|uniref:sugar phosphate isomerase/epimerase family protein n=1 Tax=Mycobacterium sp. MYCO198283 TaxID=2883505 RepID=UPI001E2A30BF|nr:sugar phosphate isomerase/epimerase [Mycobacterium sp. MYCO198283]MCG5433982.1 sugar phosphate isomerase/epimerase [Mycobacterium sp. MYCO198283]